ncbi:MAG: class I SAM-dependent methyltransferase [Proteobacteria bacterium]|nr:class I SAM-dependent methyltransferase [Pseudomonadota bacterium]MCG2742850.1 class I SAM-dependent methyltransferase [Desulfobacteraceae bacterium]MBU4030165.1 class I SAM-dependent methyltransferase [Pseudomonadota bacterium]MBU4043789.1 class I SAM-dependent methyltransferase [Pseudomonadota bacterium]MBU4085862.1 class I SAM-dependent methyltransferase [Pseudomonadota bacterium]
MIKGTKLLLEHVTETADIETASDDYASRFAGPVGKYFLDVQASLTLELLHDLPRASVLDVGGGHAQLTMPLANKGYDVTVTGSADSCRARLDKYCEKGRFSYITCDSLNLPFEDNQFDVVMAFRLLPHVHQWQRLIKEMCRVAGKAVIFDYPDKRSANILYDILFDLKKNMEGNTRTYTLFSRKEIIAELASNHFAVPVFRPEFFVPMVIHRKLQNPAISRSLETVSRLTGLTSLLGSPIILRSNIKQDI